MSSKTSIVVSADPARELTFEVVVRELRGESRHRVTVSLNDAARFAKLGADPAHAVEAAMASRKSRSCARSTSTSFGAISLNSTKRFPGISQAAARAGTAPRGTATRGGRF